MYQESNRPFSYWVDMLEYKDKAEYLTLGWVVQKRNGINSWCRDLFIYLYVSMYMYVCIYIYITKIVMIKVSDVDKYSQSQFISSCLAWGCRWQHFR